MKTQQEIYKNAVQELADRVAELKCMYDPLKPFRDEIKDLKYDLSNMSDGYNYTVKICSYGTVSLRKYNRHNDVCELIQDYADGYDGLLEIYTTNPDNQFKEFDYGCCRVIKIVTEEECENILNGIEISKSQAHINLIGDMLGLK